MLAKLGIPVTHTGIFGVHGQAWLDELKLPQPYAGKVASLRQLARWSARAGDVPDRRNHRLQSRSLTDNETLDPHPIRR